jgi:hypothetical protein
VTITAEGGRVLGCLVEKQLTTPQQYPLTGNALSLACNQATNREPVVAMDDEAVQRALDGLKAERLVRFVLPSHGRSVIRYRHVLGEVYGLEPGSVALLAVLLLRGPQTPGELRARSERMAAFTAVGDVHEQLDALASHPEQLVRLMPRRPGQKEDRWQQLLAQPWADTAGPADGSEPASAGEEPVDRVPDDHLPTGQTPDPPDRGRRNSGELSALRQDVEALQAEVAVLRASLESLRDSLGG